MRRRGYPPEFRDRALDLLDAGRKVVDLARDLGISNQTIFAWPRQEAIDRGLDAGVTSAEREELAAAKRRIRELEAELAIHRRASELLAEHGHPKGGADVNACAGWAGLDCRGQAVLSSSTIERPVGSRPRRGSCLILQACTSR
jgi:transposase